MKISNDILDHSRDQNNNSTDESKHSVDDERKDDDLDDNDNESEDGDDSGESLRPWEHRSSLRKEVPKSYDMLSKQIIKRAKFLLYLKQNNIERIEIDIITLKATAKKKNKKDQTFKANFGKINNKFDEY